MKILLSLAIIAGFAVVANADNHKATKAPVAAQDCSQIKDQKQKADCEARLAGKPAATAPAARQTK